MSVLRQTTTEDGVRTLELCRPERKNAIDLELAGELTDALAAAEDDDAVRVVVLSGAGGNFSAGGDLGGSGSEMHVMALMRHITSPALKLHHFSKPTIAKVEGVAAGAGWNLALGCDLVVAAEDARFCQIFSRRALSIDFGGTWLLPRLIGLHKAKELALFADFVSAEEAAALGLVNRIVPADALDAFVTDWASRLAAGAPIALSLTKRMLTDASGRTFDEAIETENVSQTVNLGTEDTKEGLKAFFQKRKPEFTGR